MAALLLTAGCKKSGDESIAQDLKAKISADADLKAAGVDAQVKDGEVTLTGTVPSADVELKAMKLANEEPGIKRVNDQLKVQAASNGPDNGGAAAAPVASPANPPGVSQPAAQSPAAQPPQQTAAQPSEQAPAPPPQQPEPLQAAAPPPPQPVSVTLPAGRAVSIRMIDSVDSSRNTAGQEFRASLAEPLRAHGRLVAPVGTDVLVRLSDASSAGRVRGRSELELQLVSMRLHGHTYPLVSNSYTASGKSRGAQTAKRTGIGAAAGAIIGAIAGGGKGAAIGAAVGGGGTATYQVLTRGQQVRIPSETLLQFVLQAPTTVEVHP